MIQPMVSQKGDYPMAEKKITKSMTYYLKRFPKIDGEYVKALRNKLGLSQSMFALLMRVSNKTVEKWEQGKNPVTNGNAVAMVLFNNDPSLVENFIEIEEGVPEPNLNKAVKPIKEETSRKLKLAKAQ